MPRAIMKLTQDGSTGPRPMATEEVDDQILTLHKAIHGPQLLAGDLHSSRRIAKQQQKTALSADQTKQLSRPITMYPAMQYDVAPIFAHSKEIIGDGRTPKNTANFCLERKDFNNRAKRWTDQPELPREVQILNDHENVRYEFCPS